PGRNRLINRVKAGEGCQPEPVIFGNRIHRDDCAGIITHLINRDLEGSSLEGLYLGVDNYPAPMHEVLHWLANEMDVELDDSFQPPARANKRCRNNRIVEAGYSFRFPDFRSGYTHPNASK
ncbi:MAG: SDR family NAD(P)-dependent oxidoreductase, partial [Endozoicomonas sp.]